MIHIFLGVLLIVLGLVTLFSQMFTTFLSIYFLGWLVLIAGVGQFFYGITSGSVGKTFFFVVTGIISVLIGLLAITNPALSAIIFTFFIGGLLFISGLYRVIETVIRREANWGWALAGGLISLILGGFLIATWPVSGFFAIGLFIGIELIINGALVATQPAVLVEEKRTYSTSPSLAGVKGGKSKKPEKKKTNHAKYTKSRAKKVD